MDVRGIKKIPFFDLNRQYDAMQQEIEASVRDVLRSGKYVEGPAVQELETRISEYLGVKHTITCKNGTDALRIALQANGIKRGDEVIVTTFSFFATAEAIAQIGAVPVFADIRPDHYNIDVKDIRKKISKNTRAILPVHIFGMPADMDEINEVAAQYGIPVIEDACQAIGAQYKQKKAGALATVGCFSFYPTKNLGAAGDGGMITTNDDRLAQICRAMKSHAAGKTGGEAYQYLYHEKVSELEEYGLDMGSGELYDPCKYYNYFIGGNSRLDSVQAAVLLVKLKYLDRLNQKRREISQRYSQEFSQLPIQLPQISAKDRVSCCHQYAILCDQKEALIQFMEENGVGVGRFYPVPLHLQKAFRYLNYKEGSIPVAESVCKKSVCLPVFPELREDEVAYIIEVVKKFFG